MCRESRSVSIQVHSILQHQIPILDDVPRAPERRETRKETRKEIRKGIQKQVIEAIQTPNLAYLPSCG
jgi:hypothetical protein